MELVGEDRKILLLGNRQEQGTPWHDAPRHARQNPRDQHGCETMSQRKGQNQKLKQVCRERLEIAGVGIVVRERRKVEEKIDNSQCLGRKKTVRLENLVRFLAGFSWVTNLPLSNSFNTVSFRLYWFDFLFAR